MSLPREAAASASAPSAPSAASLAPKPIYVTPQQQGSIADPLAQGLTMGFGDEIHGALNAAHQTLFNGGSFGQNYDAAVAQDRDNLAAYEGRHPILSAGAEIAGAAAPFLIAPEAMPAVTALKGAGLGAEVGNAAATGAAYGAASGFGEGQNGLGDRLKTAAIGALTGGVLGAAAPPVVATGKAMLGAAKSFVAPFTGAGRDLEAAKTIAGASSNPDALRTTLANGAQGGSDLVMPGSRPTTGQLANDAGLLGLEKAYETKGEPGFANRRGEQNAARVTMLGNAVQAKGYPEQVAQTLRSTLATIDQQTQDAIDTATQGAVGKAAAVGGNGAPEAYGTALRAAALDARAPAKKIVNELFGAIDPSGKLALPAASIRETASRVPAGMAQSAKPLAGEEAAIFAAAKEFGDSVPLREAVALRSRIGDAMAAERSTNGISQSYRRLVQLHNAVDDAIENAVEHQAAVEQNAVAEGRMTAEDTILARFGRQRDEWLHERAATETRRSTGTGDGADGALGSSRVPAASGAQGTSRGRPGSTARNPGIQAPEGSESLTPDTAAQLKAANAAHRSLKETFDSGPVGDITSGPRQGQYDLMASAVPSKVFVRGPKGFETVQAYRRAVGDGPAMRTLEDYAAADLRNTAERPDGTFDPRKIAQWRAAHGDALRAFPELNAKFADAAKASEAVAAAQAARKVVIDTFQEGVAGKLIGADSPETVTKTVGGLFGRQDSVEQARALFNKVKADPEAVQGLRKAVINHVMDNFLSNSESETSAIRELKANQFQTFFRKNEAALRQVLTKEQTDMLGAVADDMARANRSIKATKRPGDSGTAQNLHAAEHAGPHGFSTRSVIGLSMMGALMDHLAEGGNLLHAALMVGGPMLVNAFRNAGIAKIQDVVTDALLNPETATLLLTKLDASRKPSILKALAFHYRKGALAVPALTAARAVNAAAAPQQ